MIASVTGADVLSSFLGGALSLSKVRLKTLAASCWGGQFLLTPEVDLFHLGLLPFSVSEVAAAALVVRGAT